MIDCLSTSRTYHSHLIPGAMDCAGEDAREAIENAVGAATDAEINLSLWLP